MAVFDEVQRMAWCKNLFVDFLATAYRSPIQTLKPLEVRPWKLRRVGVYSHFFLKIVNATMWALLLPFFLIFQFVLSNESEPPSSLALEGRLLISKEIINKGAEVIVDGGERVCFFRGDGSFEIHGLEAGTHLLDFNVPQHVFPQVRVDMSRKKKGKVRASIAEDGKVETIKYPLLLEPKAKAQYFVPREEYSMMGMLKNPMVIMMLVFGGMAFLMPRLADPEQMKEQMQQMGMDNGQPPSLSSLWKQLQEAGTDPAPKPAAEGKKRQ
eukprot:GGOE01002277.1.p1 GENE.GGOE01002277.1~~GGOE01002277.1.p1  ORF type:complete len:268 (+),score=46.66 GGOE01002277.1:732-1535(+)